MKMRPPAIPIINIDPYFSVWSEDTAFRRIAHWTGKPNTMNGTAFIDGEKYLFFGQNTASAKKLPEMEITNIDIDAFSTVIHCRNSAISLAVHFTSPTLPEDLYYASRPVVYCNVSYESIDGCEHDVSVEFTVSEELVLNLRGEGRALAHSTDIPDVTAICMGNGEQNILGHSGDDIRIDWGCFYLGVKGKGIADHTVLDHMYAISLKAELHKEALFLFAYDDIYSIQYFGENLKAYWKKDGRTMEDVMAEAASDYEAVLTRCNDFSQKLKTDAVQKGGEKYAELLLLSVRQIMAAHKLVSDKDGNLLYISKECNSNGCAATVDLTYPSSPFFLLYNTELLKGMMRPVMHYASGEEWCFDFAPHDLGRYPLLNGQVYGIRRAPGKAPEIVTEAMMPVEESGNMIILFAAICDADNDTSFAEQYLDTIEKWSNYLIRYGEDPENQLCTDDFAGHLAHNVNLSIKAIMGIAAYSRILSRLGETKQARELMDIAGRYAESLLLRARNSDGSFRLAYDRPETFSLKYNAVWDKLWETGLFPKEFYAGEIERYKRELLPYGVPLDSREKYTKSDWLLWAASMSESEEDFQLFVASLWSAYNTMRTRVAMTDWYYCDTSHMKEFKHRSVIAGLFMKLLFP